MQTLVTGGAGFIGSHVVDVLRGAGHGVVVVDSLVHGCRDHVPRAVPLIVCDVTRSEVVDVVAAHRPLAIFHLAAQIDVRVSIQDPRHDAAVNILGTLNLLSAAQASGVELFVLASTGGAIYGAAGPLPAAESHGCAPLSPYGVSKLCAETYVALAARQSSMRTVVLRYSNVYGPRQNPHGEAGVVAIFAHQLLRGQPVSIFGDGQQTRDFVYVRDVAAANLRALEEPAARGVFNIGTGVETSVQTLYWRLASLAGVTAAPRRAPERPGEQRRSVVDPGRAAAALGWRPQTPLEVGLATTLAWFKERPATASAE